MVYIQRKDIQFNHLETIDEAENKKTAIKLLMEYKISDDQGTYYISSRPTKNWYNEK